jgi:hypothetical protein
VEIHLDRNLGRDWLAIQRGRPEAPTLDRLDRLLV